MTSLSFLALSLIPICSPGPSTIIAARNAAVLGAASAATLLIADIVGTLLTSTALQLKLSPLLVSNPQTLTIVKLAAVAYIFFVGFREVGRHAVTDRPRAVDRVSSRAWLEAFAAGSLNPKTVVFFCLMAPFAADAPLDKMFAALSYSALKAVALLTLVAIVSFLTNRDGVRRSGRTVRTSLGWFLMAFSMFLFYEVAVA